MLIIYSHLKMISERSKLCDFLIVSFFTKSISKKLLIIKIEKNTKRVPMISILC